MICGKFPGICDAGIFQEARPPGVGRKVLAFGKITVTEGALYSKNSLNVPKMFCFV